eukprot:10962068-Heterocapsa_arctica.AAC.1
MDDCGVGTGDVQKVDRSDEEMFQSHLLALERVIDRAISVDMRFALKTYAFAQLQVTLLGMMAGAGWIEPDEAK